VQRVEPDRSSRYKVPQRFRQPPADRQASTRDILLRRSSERTGIVNLEHNQRHVVDSGTATPSCHTIDDFLLHHHQRKAGCVAHNLLQSFDPKHFLLRIETLSEAIRVDDEAIAWPNRNLQRRFTVDSICEKT